MSIAASLRKNPLEGVQALGRVLAERQRREEEKQRRVELLQMIKNKSIGIQPGGDVSAMMPDAIADMQNIGNAGTVQRNVFNKPAQFGGNALTIEPQAGDGIADRLKRIRTTAEPIETQRQFDTNDITEMMNLAGDDEGAMNILSTAQKMNSAKMPTRETKVVDGGLYELTHEQGLPTRVQELVKKLQKPDEKFRGLNYDLNREKFEWEKANKQKELNRGAQRDTHAAAEWVKTPQGKILKRVAQEGDLPYKPKSTNTAFVKLAQKAEKLQRERDDIGNTLQTGVVIKNGKKMKLNLGDESVKTLLQLQHDQADSALNDVYDEINALDSAEIPADENTTGGDKRARAKAALKAQGFADDDENITTFLQNNPNF